MQRTHVILCPAGSLNQVTCSASNTSYEVLGYLASMSVRAAILVGAVTGLALGIVISVTTDVPLAPEVGLLLGALVGWLARRDR
jgi:hypothetical protein